MKHECQFEGLPQIGGHPALDLMNTVEYRGHPESGDRLNSLEQLLAWSELAGLIDQEEVIQLRELAAENPAASRRILDEVAELREEGRKALGAKLSGTVDSQALKFLAKRIERAARTVSIAVDLSVIAFRRDHPIRGLDNFVDRIALSIGDAFAAATRAPLRECEGKECDWLFFDRSRAGHRRWCHAGQCGNAERVRNFRARRTAKLPTAIAAI